jgi:HK97 family phage portal protein
LGILARALGPRYEEVRNDPGWITRDDGPDYGVETASGVSVSRAIALSLTTIWRCIDLLSSAISQAPSDVVVKVSGKSFPEYQKPQWLVNPQPGNPTYTAADYFSEVTLSLLLDGNYFVEVYPHVEAPEQLVVLDPERIRIPKRGVFQVLDEGGMLKTTLGFDRVLHGTWMRIPGMLRGISPLENLRRSIGSAVAAEDHAARFFGQGTQLSFGVEVPGKLEENQRNELQNSLRRRYAGRYNSHAVGILTAGAKFVPGLAPTPEQAQMLATRQFSVEDLCRPFGVPSHMAGDTQPGAVSYASVGGTLLEFKQYAVLPLAQRIERQHNRIVHVPENLANTNATAQFKFNLDGIARADLLTRYQAYQHGITGGFLKPREARNTEDLPPLADGSDDQLFMQAQMVPLGSLGTPAAPPIVAKQGV